MTAKALVYAESLGVHSVFDEVKELEDKLDTSMSQLDRALDKKRYLTAELEDRAFQLAGEERGKHADMSATAMREHLKGVVHKDGTSKTIQSVLTETLNDIQGLDMDIDLLRTKIKSRTARMNQLGGYFNYLAAVKYATILNNPPKP